MRMIYTYPARLEPDEIGRLVVHFPDLPEALTDGADETLAAARRIAEGGCRSVARSRAL